MMLNYTLFRFKFCLVFFLIIILQANYISHIYIISVTFLLEVQTHNQITTTKKTSQSNLIKG